LVTISQKAAKYFTFTVNAGRLRRLQISANSDGERTNKTSHYLAKLHAQWLALRAVVPLVV